MEREFGAVGSVLMSLLFVGFGILCFVCAANLGDPEGKVMCGDEEMLPDDTCVTYGNGASSRSYEEQADVNDDLAGPVFAVIGGLVCFAIAIAGFANAQSASGGPGQRTATSDRPLYPEASSAFGASDSRQVGRPGDDRPGAPYGSPEADPSSSLSQLQRGEGADSVVLSGEGAEVVVDRTGITVRNGPESLAGPGERPAERRLEWGEIRGLKLDSGTTGLKLTLYAFLRFGGRWIPLATTWSFTKADLEWMALMIDRYSEGRVRLRP